MSRLKFWRYVYAKQYHLGGLRDSPASPFTSLTPNFVSFLLLLFSMKGDDDDMAMESKGRPLTSHKRETEASETNTTGIESTIRPILFSSSLERTPEINQEKQKAGAKMMCDG